MHTDKDGQVEDKVEYPDTFPVSVGDWLLVEATMHLEIDRIGYYPRVSGLKSHPRFPLTRQQTYEVVAHHVRRLSVREQPQHALVDDATPTGSSPHSSNDEVGAARASMPSSVSANDKDTSSHCQPKQRRSTRFNVSALEEVDPVLTPKKTCNAKRQAPDTGGPETRGRKRERLEELEGQPNKRKGRNERKTRSLK